MRKVHVLVAISALVAAMALPAAASAATGGVSAVYHGAISGAAFRCGDAVVDTGRTVTGAWTMNVTGTAGVVMISAWYDGAHHTSFGMSKGVVSPIDGGVQVDFYGGYAEGGYTAVVRDGAFSWNVNLGTVCPAEYPYDSLSYLGSVVH